MNKRNNDLGPTVAKLTMRKTLTTSLVLGCTMLLAGPSLPESGFFGPGAIKCKLETLQDPQSQLPAFSYFLPGGWETNNKIGWPAPGLFNAVLSASTPDKHYQVVQIEHAVLTYNMMRGLPSKGVIIHHATDFLHVVIEQLKKQNNVENVDVVEEVNEPLPASQIVSWAGGPTSDPMGSSQPVAEAGFLQIKFDLQRVPTTASLGTTIQGRISFKHLPSTPNQILSEGGVFGVGPTTMIVAPSSPEPRKAKEMQVIASSMRMTPKFLHFWQQLTAKLAGATLRANIEGQREADLTWHERSMANFREDMHMKDAYTRQFCNYILDQQDYKDPSGSIVTLPNTYRHAWADGQGNYLISDEPTTDLRGIGTGNWKEMAKAVPGE